MSLTAGTTSRLLTLAEVADRCRVPLNTARAWRHAGIGPQTFRLGRHVLAQESDVEAFIAERIAQERRVSASRTTA